MSVIVIKHLVDKNANKKFFSAFQKPREIFTQPQSGKNW